VHQRSPAPWARLIDLRRCRCNSEADCGTRRDEARHRRARSGDATARRRRLYAGVGVSFRVLVELRKLGRRICLTAVSRVHNHHVGVAFAEHLNRKPDRLDRGVAVSCRRAEMAVHWTANGIRRCPTPDANCSTPPKRKAPSLRRGFPLSNASGATRRYRQNQTRAPNAAHNHAPAARNGLMIVWPSRSHANADKEKAMPARPVRISTHVALAVGSCANRSSITVSNFNAACRF
jgi:hypothetical protein